MALFISTFLHTVPCNGIHFIKAIQIVDQSFRLQFYQPVRVYRFESARFRRQAQRAAFRMRVCTRACARMRTSRNVCWVCLKWQIRVMNLRMRMRL